LGIGLSQGFEVGKVQIPNLTSPLFLVILLGYILKKISFFDDKTVSELNRLVYYIAFPLLLFSGTSNIELEKVFSLALLLGFPSVILTIMILSFFVSLLTKQFQRGTFIQGSFCANLVYLGLPIVLTVLGEEASGVATVLAATGTIVSTILSITILRFYDPSPKKEGALGRIKTFSTNPLIISIGAGIVFSYLEISLPEFVLDTLSLISRITLPLILLIIGFSLSFQKIKEYVLLDALSAFIKLLIMPAFCFLIMSRVFNASGTLLFASVLMAAMPTAVISYSFAKEFHSDDKLAGSIVNFSTLLSMITIPIIIYLLI